MHVLPGDTTRTCEGLVACIRLEEGVGIIMLTRGMIVVGFAASTAMAGGNVYVFSTGNAAVDAAYATALTARGHTVTTGAPWSGFDGTISLVGFDAVVMNHGANWGGSWQEVPAAGQQQLVDFVNAGGGLITTEWIIYNYATSGNLAYSTLFPILPASYGNTWNSFVDTTYSVVTPDPIMNAFLPASFTTPLNSFAGTESRLFAKPGATVFFESSNMSMPGQRNDGVSGWGVGNGRVISFSTMPGVNSLANENYAQLLSNAVDWVIVPAPGTTGLLLVAGMLAARRRR